MGDGLADPLFMMQVFTRVVNLHESYGLDDSLYQLLAIWDRSALSAPNQPQTLLEVFDQCQ